MRFDSNYGKLQSSLDAAIEMLRDLEAFKRSGSKEGFRKQLGEAFVRRSGAASAGDGHGVSSVPDAQDERVMAETRCQIAHAKKTRYA
jgi:hypothetical protein